MSDLPSDGSSVTPRLSPAEREAAIARLGGLEKIVVLRRTPAELSRLPLDPRTGFLLSLVDSMSSIEALIDMSGMTVAEVLKIVEHLLALSIVELQ